MWKNADSIKTIIPDCGYLTEVNSTITEHYFKSVLFLVYDNYAELVSIDFSKTNIELITPKITLSNNTRLKSIKKVFPNSYALKEQYVSEKKTKNTRIRLLLGRDIDQFIILDFEDQNLIYFEIWSPC